MPILIKSDNKDRLLIRILILILSFLICVMPVCLQLQPAYIYLIGLVTTVTGRVIAFYFERKGYNQAASWSTILGLFFGCSLPLIAGCAIGLLPGMLVYGFFNIIILQSAIVVNTMAPLVFAMLSISTITIFFLRNTSEALLILESTLHVNPWVIWFMLSLNLLVLAITTTQNARKMEKAIRKAYRTGEIEALYHELRTSHQELEEYSGRLVKQSVEMEKMNSSQVTMQAELVASHYRLEYLNKQLEEQAATDGLTGLMNRRAFQEALHQRISHAHRYKEPLSLLMLDVDNFKRYNDNYGHPAGDEVLRIISRIMQDTTRIGDQVARYGGEEFAIILPQADMDLACMVADRIKENVCSYAFPESEVTISIGVATLHRDIEDPDMLVCEADSALYNAKRAGRNRVLTATTSSNETTGKKPAVLDSDEDSSKTFSNLDQAVRESRMNVSEMITSFGGVEGLLQEPSGPVLNALLAALDLRDTETEGHSQRVARYALKLAAALSAVYDSQRFNKPLAPWITPSDLRDLAVGALLHDIGKIRLPDQILRKPSTLNEEEYAFMRRHPIIGAELICEFALLVPALSVVLHHHERWDGLGYPDGLSGEAIPLAARIFAVCDTYDAITTNRPYRNARTFEVAKEVIRMHSGTQFDPDVVEAFMQVDAEEWQQLAGLAASASEKIHLPEAA